MEGYFTEEHKVYTERVCETCGGKLSYNEFHDALYCKGCDVWREVQCPDPECGFCSKRPDKPSQATS